MKRTTLASDYACAVNRVLRCTFFAAFFAVIAQQYGWEKGIILGTHFCMVGLLVTALVYLMGHAICCLEKKIRKTER